MKYEKIDDYLQRTVSEDNYEKPSILNKGKKRSRKGIVAVLIAGALILTTAITGLVSNFGKKKNTNDKTYDKTPTKTVEATTSISTFGLNDLGNELDFKSKKEQKKEQYGNPTGNVDVNKIVEKDGTYYVDKKSAEKAKDVGKTTPDTKNNKYVVDEDGTVKEKETGYEVTDPKTGETVTVKDSNNDGIPDGYEKNEELGGIFEEADNTELYTICDANYYGYDKKGKYTIIFKKGDIILKETLKRIKKELSTNPNPPTESVIIEEETTTKKAESTTKKEETTTQTVVVDEGKINSDGTYTIYGMTFESKADYQQWVLQGYEGYAEADGIMRPEAELTAGYQKTK